jgi:MarR family transcriptional regulator, organic hydroperoxide resistance regulator
MTNEKIKQMFDACYQAKRVREMLPPLPKGVMPSYIQFLDTIQMLQKEKGSVRISDISDARNLPRPGVTRTVKEMEEKGYLQKVNSSEDGRITYITITEKGKKLFQKYDQDYFSNLAEDLSELSDKEADCMIQTIEKLYQIMIERKEHYGK